MNSKFQSGLIRRSDAMNALLKQEKLTKSVALRVILQLPDAVEPADAAPVRKWQWADSDYTPHSQCTICGEWVLRQDKSIFCPNCGAKMDGGEQTIAECIEREALRDALCLVKKCYYDRNGGSECRKG